MKQDRDEPGAAGMCGRFTQSFNWAEIQNFYNLLNELAPNLKPSWNVAPTQEIATIGLRETGGLGLTRMRWGLAPSWAKDASIGSKMINARADSIAEKPAFREAFAKRRCIIPVSGFFEWHGTGTGKTPHYITSATGEPLSLAGLWERWRDPQGEWLRSATIITTDANDALRPLHHRMPVILGRADVETWLADGGHGLLKPCPGDWLTRWPVSTRVNNVRNDAPDLIVRTEAATLL
jgi:putative SOS response-associated peptidase YedK